MPGSEYNPVLLPPWGSSLSAGFSSLHVDMPQFRLRFFLRQNSSLLVLRLCSGATCAFSIRSAAPILRERKPEQLEVNLTS